LKDKKEHIDKEYLSELQLKLYREGKMTPQEMRRVEGLLEKYPLYAEALEGLSLLDEKQTAKHIGFLQENIQAKVGKNKQAKTVFLSSPNLRRVAATVLVLIVFSFGLYFVNNQINKEIATKESTATEARMYLEDSIQLASPLLSEETATETPKEQNIIESEKKYQKELALKNNNNKYTAEKQAYDAPLAVEVAPPTPISNQTAVQDSALLVLKKADKPADDLPKSVPAKTEEEETVQRKSETEDIQAEKERKKVDVNRKNKTSHGIIGNTSPPLDNQESNYADSLKIYLRNFAKEKNEILKGKLSVSFYLNQLHQIQNITVKEIPCPSCENVTIKWIQEYKHWQKYRTGEKSIEIVFE
jgi:hypothetical protein